MISIIVPTLNELQNLPKLMARIAETQALVPFEREIIFVDDSSSDGTQAAVEALALKDTSIRLVRSPMRRGLGAAIKLGIEQSQGNFLLLLDCDVSVSTKDLARLISSRAPDTMMIGSRYLRESRIYGASQTKVFLSRTLNWLLHFLLGITAYDISHSLRIFPRPTYALPQNNTHPAFFWELSLLGQHYLDRVAEVPVDFTEREFGTTKNTTLRMLKSTIQGISSILKIKGQLK